MNAINPSEDAMQSYRLLLTCKNKKRENIYGEVCLIDKIYRTTNESASGYMPDLIEEGDRVLSVAASGDQYLNSILYGASEVDLFDINAITYYFNILKIVSAKVLPVEDFKKFLVSRISIKENTYMDKKYYDYVKEFLPNNVREYFDRMYFLLKEESNYDNPWLLLTDGDSYKLLEDTCPYLIKFNDLQTKLQNLPLPRFFLGDLQNVLSRLEGKYNKMLFSNIHDYIDFFIDDIAYNYGYPHLEQNGIIQLAYFWYDIKKSLDFGGYTEFDYEKYGIMAKNIEASDYDDDDDIKQTNEVLLMSRKYQK